jgi:hypothetical protein
MSSVENNRAKAIVKLMILLTLIDVYLMEGVLVLLPIKLNFYSLERFSRVSKAPSFVKQVHGGICFLDLNEAPD